MGLWYHKKTLMKTILNIFTLFISITVLSQQKVADFNADNTKEKNLFSVLDDKGRVVLFMAEKNKLTGIQFDDSFQITDSISIPFNPKELKKMVASHPKQNQILIYWLTKNKNELYVQQFDFENKKVTANTIIVDPGKEKIVANFTNNNFFYVVTFTKNESTINVYKTDGNLVEKKVIDCSKFRFVNSSNQKVNLWNLYDENSGTVYYSGFESISDASQTSLVKSTSIKKAYIRDQEVIFSFDNSTSYTQLLKVDLKNFTATQKEYAQLSYGFNETNNGLPNSNIEMSNSFIINNKLIQVKNNAKSLSFQIVDFDGNVITKNVVKPDEDFGFNTSPMYLEEGSFKKRKELDSSKKLLRKIYYLNLSVTGYYHDGKYNLTLGGVSYPQQNSFSFGMFGLIGALIDVAINHNNTISNINSYSNKNVVYINAMFDEDFNSLPNNPNTLALEKLRLFVEENDKFINPTIFDKDSKIYYVGFNKESKKYGIYVFEN